LVFDTLIARQRWAAPLGYCFFSLTHTRTV